MRTRAIIAIAVFGGVAVAGGALLVLRDDEPFRNSPAASDTLDQIDPSVANDLDATDLAPAETEIAPPAAKPEAAVRELLEALIGYDAAASFSRLDEAARRTYGPLPTWQDRSTSLPRYLSYEVLTTEGATVTTAVAIEPRLDEIVGYVPARATITWTTTPEDGGYRVALAETLTEPMLPTDGEAAQATQAWLAARQRCEPGVTYAGNLLGQPVLADELCGAKDSLRAGDAVGLDAFSNPTVLLDAFGGEAQTFVRIVPVDGPTPFDVALAPLGNQWQVVGLMQR